MIAVASPDAQRSAQPAQLGDADVQRIAYARDKVSRDKRNVRLQIVRHVHCARNFVRRHVVANVYVAKLSDAQPIQLRRKIGDGHIDALNRVTQAFGGKPIGSGKERKASSKNSGVLEECPARGIELTGYRAGMQSCRGVRDPLDRAHRFDRDESED